jgi:hypothetical protein
MPYAWLRDDVAAVKADNADVAVFGVGAARSVEEAEEENARHRPAVGPEGVGYVSPHYLVALDERRADLPEWSRFAGLKARIDVRTALHDAWQTIDLDFPFHAAASYPVEVRDLLARSTLGLSAIDADLAEAKQLVPRLLGQYEEAIAAGDLRLPLNGISLIAYLRSSALVHSLVEVGEDVGLTPAGDYEPDWYWTEAGLLWLLRSADLHTLAELEDFLKQATPRARHTLAEILRLAADREFTPAALPESIVEWLWLVLRRADAETIELLQYIEELRYALNTLIGNPVHEEPEAP